MNDANRKRVEDFMRSLEGALELSESQSESILAEVRADLEAHVKRFRGAGYSEDEAVTCALDEMGNPFELAHYMRREIPPFGGKALTMIRYVAASGVILWTLLLLWYFRAWNYGFSPTVIALAVLFHLPVILLLWPRIVWKKNWLFGLIPAGLGLLAALIYSFGGVESSSEIALPLDALRESALEVPVEQPVEIEHGGTPAVPVAAALLVVALVLLMVMQQRPQRRAVLLAILLPVACVEAVFQVEEMIFRQDRKRIREYVAETFRKQGAYPTKDAFKSERSKLASKRVSFRMESDNFQILWSRPLSSGFSIAYSSKDERVWIQD